MVLSLSLSITYLGLIVLQLWIMNSWYEFRCARWLWFGGFLGFAVLVVIRWVFGFHRAQWHCCICFTVLNGMIWVLSCSMVSLCLAFVGFWVSLCWLWSDYDMSFLGFAMFCGAGLAEQWVAVWWTFRDERDRDKLLLLLLLLLLFYNTATVQFYMVNLQRWERQR